MTITDNAMLIVGICLVMQLLIALWSRRILDAVERDVEMIEPLLDWALASTGGKHTIYLVYAEQPGGVATIEGSFVDRREEAEQLARDRGGWVDPLVDGEIFPEGNAGPFTRSYWPPAIDEDEAS